MEGIVKQAKIGYVVYGERRGVSMFGYHGKGDKGYPQKELTECTPFCSPREAKSYIKWHMKDDAEILEVQYDTTYTYKTLKQNIKKWKN